MFEDYELEDWQKDFLEAIEDGEEYDWIANNYYKLRRDDLKDIALEVLYASVTNAKTLTEGLLERWT